MLKERIKIQESVGKFVTLSIKNVGVGSCKIVSVDEHTFVVHWSDFKPCYACSVIPSTFMDEEHVYLYANVIYVSLLAHSRRT